MFYLHRSSTSGEQRDKANVALKNTISDIDKGTPIIVTPESHAGRGIITRTA